MEIYTTNRLNWTELFSVELLSDSFKLLRMGGNLCERSGTNIWGSWSQYNLPVCQQKSENNGYFKNILSEQRLTSKVQNFTSFFFPLCIICLYYFSTHQT